MKLKQYIFSLIKDDVEIYFINFNPNWIEGSIVKNPFVSKKFWTMDKISKRLGYSPKKNHTFGFDFLRVIKCGQQRYFTDDCEEQTIQGISEITIVRTVKQEDTSPPVDVFRTRRNR